MHILITYVGYDLSSSWVAYDRIRHKVLPIDLTVILCSTYQNKDGMFSYDLANELAKRIYLSEVPADDIVTKNARNNSVDQNYGGKVLTKVLDTEQNMDYDFVHDYLISLYTDNGEPRVTMNITNGNGKTKAAMCIAASEIGASIYYVDHNPISKIDTLEKVIDCRAVDSTKIGKTEAKVLWAIKEIEDAHYTQNDSVTLRNHGKLETSLDSVPNYNRPTTYTRDLGNLTQTDIWKHTVDAKWPKPLSAQIMTGTISSLKKKGLIKLEDIDNKSKRIKLTSTGRIALSKITSRPR